MFIYCEGIVGPMMQLSEYFFFFLYMYSWSEYAYRYTMYFHDLILSLKDEVEIF